MPLTQAQLDYMVQRFLAWKLPDDFNPDAGISFTPTFTGYGGHPMRHDPVGTNLFTAEQAKAMILHMTDGLRAE